jgi:hypothetical protein
MDHARFFEKLPTLRHERWVAHVVGSFDVISQRALKLLNGLSDRQGHLTVL